MNHVIPRWFVAIATSFGALLAFLTPPFQAPDEPAHFYRAFSVSELNWTARRSDGRLGAYLPLSLTRTVVSASGDVPYHPENKVDVRELAGLFRIPLHPSRRQFVPFPNTAMYSPAAYIPQALGIGIGRAFSLPPIALLYAGRLANVGIWIVLISTALRSLPTGKWLMFLLALMPMTLFLAASVSADAPATALSFLLIASFVRSTMPGFRPDSRWFAIVCLCSILLILCKLSLFPVMALWTLVPVAAFGCPRIAIRHSVLYLTVCVGITVASVLVLWFAYFPVLSGGAPLASKTPTVGLWPALKVLVGTLVRDIPEHCAGFVGILGWRDTYLPPLFTYVYLGVLGMVSVVRFADEHALRRSHRILMAGVASLAAMLIVGIIWILAILYGRRPPDSPRMVMGVNGRYFIPLAPLVFLALKALPVRYPQSRRWVAGAILAFSGLSLSLTVKVLVERYYG